MGSAALRPMPEAPPGPLAHHADAAARLAGAVEPCFLDAATGLWEMLAAQRQAAADFAALGEGFSHDLVAGLQAGLDAISGHADALSRLGAAGDGILPDLMRRFDDAADTIRKLTICAATLARIAVNGRILIGSLGSGRDDVAAFMGDVERLAQSVSEATRDLATVFAGMNAQMAAAWERGRAAGPVRRDPIPEAVAWTRAGAADLEAVADAALTASRHGRAQSEAASQRLSRVIEVMQSGDSVRQRLEHVASALRHGGEHGACLAGDAEREAFLGVLLALEAAQLDAAAREFGGEIDAALAELDGLAAEAGIDPAVMAAAEQAMARAARFSERLGRVQADLMRSTAELAETARLTRACIGAAAALAGTADRFGPVELEMRLVSINAELTSGKIAGDGLALRVISLQLREETAQICVHAERFRAVLDEVKRLLAAFPDASAETEALGQSCRAFAEAIGDLHAGTGRVVAAMRRIRDAEAGQQLAVRCAVASLEAAGRLNGSIGALRGDLSGGGELRAAIPAGALSPEDAACLDRLAAAYTMNAERNVHRALFGQPLLSDAPSAGGGDDLDLGDILF